MKEEYRIVYDLVAKCGCPSCPVDRRHVDKDLEYGTYGSLERARGAESKAYNMDGVENVRLMKRTVTDWEETF